MLKSLKESGYCFQAVESFICSPEQKTVILRHDVDRLPENALKIARIEKEFGVCATYYFRAVPESYDETIMEQIADSSHEVGYHYENMDAVLRTVEGREPGVRGLGRTERDEDCKKEKLVDAAYEDFCKNLEMFRQKFDVRTICMHGSPLSKYDNRDIWKKYDYRDLGIIGEPYFDINFNEVFYLTDTGRRWDGDAVSIRDKVGGRVQPYHSTFDIIRAAQAGRLPDRLMINIHPQRWHDKPLPWVMELVFQNIKNIAKAMIVKTSQSKLK